LFPVACAWSCQQPRVSAHEVIMFYGHRGNVRAFAAISYRFLRYPPHLAESGCQRLAFAGFVATSSTQQPERPFE
jgi:hypothetical protein